MADIGGSLLLSGSGGQKRLADRWTPVWLGIDTSLRPYFCVCCRTFEGQGLRSEVTGCSLCLPCWQNRQTGEPCAHSGVDDDGARPNEGAEKVAWPRALERVGPPERPECEWFDAGSQCKRAGRVTHMESGRTFCDEHERAFRFMMQPGRQPGVHTRPASVKPAWRERVDSPSEKRDATSASRAPRQLSGRIA